MRQSALPLLIGLTSAIVAGCQKEQPQATTPPPDAKAPAAAPAPAALLGTNEVAVFKTSAGELVVEFWPEVAPNTVENFKKLARQGFYDGTASHRLIRGFMIQMGDPLTKDPATADRWGSGGPGYTIKAEFNDRKHERGVLSMARTGDPDSAGSQFFICFGPAPALDRQYTTFGKVIRGDDVLTKLEATQCGPGGDGAMSAPLQRVAVESIRLLPGNSIR